MQSFPPRSSFRVMSALAALTLTLAGGAAHSQGASQPVVIAQAAPAADGVIRIQSTHSVEETAARVKSAVEAKGIRYFDTIDQAALGESAKLPIGKSMLVLFGNPPLGVQFLQANLYAGLDWPVRMLVVQEPDGRVWIAWSDFRWIARRYAMKGRDMQLKMAADVAATIASEAAH